VVLSQAEYARAWDAHRDGQRVEVSGVLQRDANAQIIELLLSRGFRVDSQAGAGRSRG
jgi:hypothetical protein